MGPIFAVEGDSIVSADNPLDFHDERVAVLTFNLKYLNNGLNIKEALYHLLQNDSCQ